MDIGEIVVFGYVAVTFVYFLFSLLNSSKIREELTAMRSMLEAERTSRRPPIVYDKKEEAPQIPRKRGRPRKIKTPEG